MFITVSSNVNDSTYCRTGHAEPTINQDGSITIYDGQGTRRGWGTPGTTSTVVLNDDDFCAVHVGFHHKHGGGQFWRYFTTNGTEVRQVEWREIPDEQRQRILDGAQDKAPSWAKAPGKLRSNYAKPTFKTFTSYKLVEVRQDGTLVSIYTGEIYTIGKRMVEKAREEHQGGYYSHPTQEQVLALWNAGTLVPEDCYRPGMMLALIECHISGTIVVYANGKVASTYLTPIAVIDTFVYEPVVA